MSQKLKINYIWPFFKKFKKVTKRQREEGTVRIPITSTVVSIDSIEKTKKAKGLTGIFHFKKK